MQTSRQPRMRFGGWAKCRRSSGTCLLFGVVCSLLGAAVHGCSCLVLVLVNLHEWFCSSPELLSLQSSSTCDPPPLQSLPPSHGRQLPWPASTPFMKMPQYVACRSRARQGQVLEQCRVWHTWLPAEEGQGKCLGSAGCRHTWLPAEAEQGQVLRQCRMRHTWPPAAAW